jgi:hypothetical protein
MRGADGHDVGAGLEDGVWWTYPEDRRTPGVHAWSGEVSQDGAS